MTPMTSVRMVRSRKRSSWTGGSSPSGEPALSRLRSAGSTSLRRRSTPRVDRLSATGCSSGHDGRQVAAAGLAPGQVGGPVGPDQERELGHQLSQVEALLHVAGRHVAIAGGRAG